MNSHGVTIEISDVDSDISCRYSNTLASFPRSDETASHSTRLSEDDNQVAGYPWERLCGRSASRVSQERHQLHSNAVAWKR